MTVTTPTAPGRIKVAIIGAGPAGLGAAIALNKHGFVDWQVYEKKPEVSEIGNGISLQQNTWRMLERLGAAGNLTAEQLFRPASAKSVQHR